ncbi:COG2958 family protein [Turicibacter sanguinis]|uniref:COG2958 family protein n=1 Tax=Turicibacter sanguinis TaxID=154288 RepID=UPI00189C761F|nr:HTH domain-containing protein [Turicibacter sanguinis]
MSYSFIDLIIETLTIAKAPLSPTEIWDKAVELNIADKLNSSGKTPWRTLASRIYIDIRDNPDTPFIQVSKRPAKFYLKDLTSKKEASIIEDNFIENNNEGSYSFKERDLHPLLVKFLYSHAHFKCYSKTIYHENSNKKQKGYNKWLHPDLVGVYFPFNDYLTETQKLQEAFKISSYKLFSFELKIKLNFANLRECYFQAVSNSSWANEGYLVALEIDDDPLLRDELRRLNNSFGIGIIKLNSSEIEQSEILFPSKEKEFIDWETIDRLADENGDFKCFMSDLTEDIKVGKVKSKYDKVYGDSEYIKYLEEKNIVS